jgi:hypothetical protein
LLRNRWELPSPLTRGLRRLVSKAGTGDNPGNAGGNPALWRLKSAVLSRASRLLPVLGDLQDYRLRPDALAGARPVALPIRAGDAVFFHSLLPHATGPNLSANDRWADVISYMPADALVSAGAATEFPVARRAA